VASFDSAFRSRIHIAINYPDLDFESRKAIWRSFIAIANKGIAVAATTGAATASTGGVGEIPSIFTEAEDENKPTGISDKDLEYLALKVLNGRQIKNIMKAAHLLATRKSNEQISLSHIETVLGVSNGGEAW